MKRNRFFASFLGFVFAMTSFAQSEKLPFKVKLYNPEYSITMVLNLYEEAVTIPGCEFLGPTNGYIEGRINGTWYIVRSAVKDSTTAEVKFINDGGSETQVVELVVREDGKYEFSQKDGTEIRYPKGRKYEKIPSPILFNLVRYGN